MCVGVGAVGISAWGEGIGISICSCSPGEVERTPSGQPQRCGEGLPVFLPLVVSAFEDAQG